MVYRKPDVVPAASVPEARRGRVQGRFCLACGSVYPLHRSHHRGKPSFGRDHVASPCSHEGERFERGDDWWDRAVELRPPEPEAEPEAG